MGAALPTNVSVALFLTAGSLWMLGTNTELEHVRNQSLCEFDHEQRGQEGPTREQAAQTHALLGLQANYI